MTDKIRTTKNRAWLRYKELSETFKAACDLSAAVEKAEFDRLLRAAIKAREDWLASIGYGGDKEDQHGQ